VARTSYPPCMLRIAQGKCGQGWLLILRKMPWVTYPTAHTTIDYSQLRLSPTAGSVIGSVKVVPIWLEDNRGVA